MRSSSSWWGRKVRQARAHLAARVTDEERAGLAVWLTPAELALFDAMPVADRRHGLDVVARLRDLGARDPDLLLAGLLHDCGKGPSVRLAHRVAWSLSERYGSWLLRPIAVVPGMAPGCPGSTLCWNGPQTPMPGQSERRIPRCSVCVP